MFYNGKNKSVSINGIPMSYVEFGYGRKNLVLIPGLTDGLKTVKGQALTLAYYYRELVKDFKIYIFSRKDTLTEGYTTKNMADDLKTAFDVIGIKKTYLMGVSQGGMVSQRFTIANPGVVEKLMLVVSASRPNDVIRSVIGSWIQMAKRNDYRSLMIDTLEKTYSEEKLKSYRIAYPIISRIGKPKDFSRFLIQAASCLTHNAYDELERISCPVFIAGGDSDKIVGPDASPEMADRIKGSKLHIYKGLGHAAYEEGKDFNRRVLDFLGR